jgi:sulfur relay protein TusB/DsrH
MPAPQSSRSCLHLVVSARLSALQACLDQRLEGDDVVFIDAGVMHLLDDFPDSPDLAGPGFCFSIADLEARGLVSMARRQGVRVLDDRAVARLLSGHEHCLTWK